MASEAEFVRDYLNRAEIQARAEYRASHWGESGSRKSRQLEVADIRSGVVVELGDWISVVYRTSKGGEGLTYYEHEFKKPYPVLAYCQTGTKKKLVVCGGGYDVRKEGIVG